MANLPFHPYPNPQTTFHSSEDHARLLPITEESIFLHDGILQAQDLVPCSPNTPNNLLFIPTSVTDISQLEELLTIETNDTKELGQRITKLSTMRVKEIARHHRYQFQVLKTIWKYKYEKALEMKAERDFQAENALERVDSVLPGTNSGQNLGLKLNLCLLVPILQSYSELNPEIALSTVQLLFEELANVPVMSLANETSASLEKLEDLLCHWVSKNGESFHVVGSSALVALSCARGQLSSLLKTLCVLDKCPDSLAKLPVSKLLDNLEEIGRKASKPCALNGSNHILTWPLNSDLKATALSANRELGTSSHPMLEFLNNQPNENVTSSAPPDSLFKVSKREVDDPSTRSYIATDGPFLYVTGPKGKGLSKIGSGYDGTLRDQIYSKNIDLNCGFVAVAKIGLLTRPLELDTYDEKIDEKNVLGVMIDRSTLKPDCLVLIDYDNYDVKRPYITIALVTDGQLFYHVRSELPLIKSKNGNEMMPPSSKLLSLYLDVCEIKKDDSKRYAFATVVKSKILLQKSDTPLLHNFDVNRFEERVQPGAHSGRTTNLQAQIMQSANLSAVAAAENYMSSLGVYYKQLAQSLVFTCGNYLTFIMPNYWVPLFNPSSSISPPPPPGNPCSTSSNGMKIYSPVMSLHCSRTLGTQVHVKINGPRLSFHKQELADMPMNSSFYNGAMLQQMSGTYDAAHNLIWTTNGDYVDTWKNPGHFPYWKQNELMLYVPVEVSNSWSQKDISIRQTIRRVMKHISRMGIHFLGGDKEADIGFVVNSLESILELMLRCLRNFDHMELKAIFTVLRVVLSQIKSTEKGSALYNNLLQVQSVLFCFISDKETTEKFSQSKSVYMDVGELFALMFDYIHTTSEDRNTFLKELQGFVDEESEKELPEGRRYHNSDILKQELLKSFTTKLENPGLSLEDGLKWILDEPWLLKVIRNAVQGVDDLFSKLDIEKEEGEGPLLINDYTTASFPYETKYIAAVANFILRSWILQADKPRESLRLLLIATFKPILNYGCMLVERGIEFVSSKENLSMQDYSCCEEIFQSSILGLVLPQILAFLASEEEEVKDIEEGLLEECIQLTVAMSHLAEKLNCSRSWKIGEDWSSQMKVPAPWTHNKIIESMHPLKEGSKLKETIVIPDAKQLFLKFSPQCATQYDYDKLTIFQGCGPTAKKIAECGGNYYGCGNRNFSGPGWPRGLIRIDGNVMSYSFDIRSTRETASTDKAMFGYMFTIYPSFDYSYPGKPELEKNDQQARTLSRNGLCSLLSLHCIDVVQKIVMRMGSGDPESTEEMESRTILRNGLASRLRWHNHKEIRLLGSPRKFSTEFLTKLKRDAGVASVQIRQRLEEKMRMRDFEDAYLQCCLKHAGQNQFLNDDMLSRDSTTWSNGPGYELVRTIFWNIDTIVRHIMSVAEMEKMLIQDVEDISKDLKKLDEAFFCDPEFRSSHSNMAMLAMICDLEYDRDSPSNLIDDLSAMVQAFIEGGTAPQLTRLNELIEETHLKCQYLLHADPRLDVVLPEPSLEDIKRRISDIQSFVFSHFQSPKANMKNFYRAMTKNQGRAIGRVEAYDILLKVLQCSKSNAALLTVAAIALMKGPGLSTVSCSGLEKDVILRYGEALKTVIEIAQQNPLLHRFTVALLCVIGYNKTDELNLVESGLLGILDQLCAFQMQDPTPEIPTTQISSLRDRNGSDESKQVTNIYVKASTLAWAAFRVLSSRCASWEKSVVPTLNCFGEDVSNALPVQISANVTNHLARAANLAAISNVHQQTTGISVAIPPVVSSLTEAIQDVLGLLSSLQEYKIGRAILKQSPCICRLLSLLQDPRLSPRLVLTILKLLNTALPLVDNLETTDFSEIILAKNNPSSSNNSTSSPIQLSPHHQVANMLLSKLADFLVCGSQHLPKGDSTSRHVCSLKSTSVITGLLDPAYPQVSVWIQKRADQLAAPMLRQIFMDSSRTELRPSRASINQLETELNSKGKVLLYTEDSVVAERKAMRLGQLGYIVILEPPSSRKSESKLGQTGAQTSSDTACKEKNANLAAWDLPRPFISGHVAECLASQIVQLLRSLLSSSKQSLHNPSALSSKGSLHTTASAASQSTEPSVTRSGAELLDDIVSHLKQRNIWSTAVEQVLCLSLKPLPKLLNVINPTTTPLESFAFSARLAIASLTVLGAFTETIRSGSEVWILEERQDIFPIDDANNEPGHCDFKPLKARVLNISDSNETADVKIIDCTWNTESKKTYNVPLSRLVQCHNHSVGADLPSLSKSAETEIGNYLKALLVPNASTPKPDIFTLNKALPSLKQIVTAAGITSGLSLTTSTGRVSESRAIAHGMTVVRLLAEIRTRCMQVLSQWLKNTDFLGTFLGKGSQTVLENQSQPIDTLPETNALKLLAKNCKPSHRLKSVENQVALMRLLYRDCTRPPRLANVPEKCPCLNIEWNILKTFPKVRSCVISTSTNSVLYLGDSNASVGQPRGLLLYANYGTSAEGFYWEATVLSMDESSTTSDTMLGNSPISIGFGPESVPPDQRSSEAWKYPAGTVLLTTGGRIYHYRSLEAVNCVITRLEGDVKIAAGDTIGIGWERLPQGNPQFVERQEPLPMSSARHTTRSNAVAISSPPPPPPLPSARRVRIRNTNGSIATGRMALNNASFGPKGSVFFTVNGKRLPNVVEQTNCGLLPMLHIQRRGVIISANFGAKPFQYLEAKKFVTAVPTTAGHTRPLYASASAGSSDSGPLLRRVSDSLQDLSMGLNYGAFSLDGIDSDSDLEIHIRTESDDAFSASSNDSSELMAMSLEETEAGTEDSLFGDDNSSTNDAAIEQSVSNTEMSRDIFANQIAIHITPAGQPQPFHSESSENVRRPRNPVHNSDPTTYTVNSRFIAPGSTKCNLVAKPEKKSSEYNPIASLDYFLESSPTNGVRVFSGPNRMVCSCSSNCPSLLDSIMMDVTSDNKKGSSSRSARRRRAEESDIDPVSSDDEEDIHAQLVRAWEQQVFPIIRRRFRNESERRDGLEQIRGALQLGMIDIARQTVEFLYEEGGVVPRDLHFPTIEEVRAEGTRCTMERVRPGMIVLIRPLPSLNESNSVLPPFAVSAMLRTFGLVGEVLEVNKELELVLVETYVESEGILLRFWYPVIGLDKPQATRKPNLNTNTVNMFKLHSNLLSLESSLCHIYSRSSFLQILNSAKEDVEAEQSISGHSDQSNLSLDKASPPQPVQNTLENIQILSDHCMAAFPPNGNVLTCNLTHTCPSIKFLTDLGNPLAVLYTDSEKLTEEIKSILINTCRKGQDALNEVITQFLSVIEHGSEKFPSFEVAADMISEQDIEVPDAAFTLICVKGLQPPKNASNSVDSVLHSCIHLSCFDSSDIKRHPLVCYPLHSLFPVDTTDSSNNRAQRSQLAITSARKTMQVHRRKLRFPPVLIPTNKVHLTVSDTELKGLVVHIQGIPSQFPLGLLFFQTLVEFFRENETVSIETLVFAASKFTNFLCINSMPPLIKEWVICLLTEAISVRRDEGRFPADFNLFRPDLADRVFAEMLFIYEKESESVSNAQSFIVSAIADHFTSEKESTSQAAATTRPGKANATAESKATITNIHDAISIFLDSNKKPAQICCFSGYFQSLLEFCLAINDIYPLSFNPLEIIRTLPVSISSASPTPSRKQSGQVAIVTPTSAQAKGRRLTGGITNKTKSNVQRSSEPKKVDRVPKAPKHQPQPTLILSTERASSAKSLASTGSEDPGYRSHDFNWFCLTEQCVLALRNLVWNDNSEECVQAMTGIVTMAYEKLCFSTNPERLVVVYGAPINVPGMSLETSLLRALKDCGGVVGNEIWISENSAVVEIRCGFRVTQAIDILKQNKSWYPLDDSLMYPSVKAFRVSTFLRTGDIYGDNTLMTFLRGKVLDPTDSDKLCAKAEEALSAIFMSCCVTTEFLKSDIDEFPPEDQFLLLNSDQLSAKISGNLMERFVNAVKPETYSIAEFTKEIVRKFGERTGKGYPTNVADNAEGSSSKSREYFQSTESNAQGFSSYSQESVVPNDIPQGPSKSKNSLLLEQEYNRSGLSQNGFLQWCTQLTKDNIQGLWNGIFATGYDLRLDRAWPMDSTAVSASQYFSTQWTKEKDAALVAFIDSTAASLRLSPERIHPHEIYLSDADLTNPMFRTLQGTPIEYLRVRAAVLGMMHTAFGRDLLPYIGFHKYSSYKRSIAALMHEAKYLMFYSLKEYHLYNILSTTAQRGGDSSQEIFLDPVTALDSVGGSDLTLIHQAIPQLQAFSSASFCIPPSRGSDPVLPVNIKYQGEEVLGLSGSFRHFLLNVSKEIQRGAFNIFCKCPSSDAGRNKDSLIFHPGPISYTEEELLYFVGQMMGIAIRSDSTFPLYLIKSGWRSLLLSGKEINDVTDDLAEADILCATYIKNIQSLTSSTEFDAFLTLNGWPKFQYPSMDENSTVVALCPGGQNLSLSYSNKEQFISLIEKLRTKEVRARNRVNRILAGLATIIPLPIFLNFFTSTHLEFKICGSPEIDLSLLKAHTHYQVGVGETDPHIMYFWSALESFTPEELRKFVKFACNLERLPASCPCQSGTVPQLQGHVIHISPFPMKIAPTDFPANTPVEEIDKRLIRVETCLFLIRLPPYSSLQITKQQLLYAINCRDDPLSG